MRALTAGLNPNEPVTQRTATLFHEALDDNYKRTDRMFAWLMVVQWLAGIAAALWISPRAWAGTYSYPHIHVWAAIFLGGMISSFPVFMAVTRPGSVLTRHAIAAGQMLSCGLLIHLTGGRIETHFQYFGALAFLAFYRDWRVLATASAVAGLDHFIRGVYWPQSMFGVSIVAWWRWMEHVGWVLFEDVFLMLAIRQNLAETMGVAERQAKLEAGNEILQAEIAERKRAEWGLNIQDAMSRILAESSSAVSNSKVLQGFCEALGWNVGVLWMADHRDALLHCAEIWSSPNLQADAFKMRSRGLTFVRGAGLPGRVWANNRPEWIREIADDTNFPRTLVMQLGLHSAFAFPILIGNGVGAVVEFFSLAVWEQDDGLLRICANLGSQLGQFFERNRAESHLHQSQKMETVGKLAGGIAHEFNSIMTAIIGHSEFLLTDLPPESPLCKNAQQIREAADRAAALTRQLLAFGRKQILQPEILDLNSIVAGMENVLRHLMGNNGKICMTLGAGLKAVKADAGQIEQVIVNIAMNAADAMPNGGTLNLETANVTLDEAYVGRFSDLKAGEYVMLAITDTGAGMSEAVKTRVFEPFFSTKGVGQGTGLGLATCYGILKQSGGHISVYSEVARGSTFKIYLPQVEAPAKIPVKRVDAPELPRGTETILLVEDDPALREMAATLLTRLGYNVMTAANGVEALGLKQQRGAGHVDLLFTDVVMPHMSGKELADRVQVLYPHTRILFTSAYTESSIVHQGVLNPGVTLLQKPFTPSALARKVREVLDRNELVSAP
jgi:two-component system, cell cycle sensor histidine kinase and response regulator CckA